MAARKRQGKGSKKEHNGTSPHAVEPESQGSWFNVAILVVLLALVTGALVVFFIPDANIQLKSLRSQIEPLFSKHDISMEEEFLDSNQHHDDDWIESSNDGMIRDSADKAKSVLNQDEIEHETNTLFTEKHENHDFEYVHSQEMIHDDDDDDVVQGNDDDDVVQGNYNGIIAEKVPVNHEEMNISNDDTLSVISSEEDVNVASNSKEDFVLPIEASIDKDLANLADESAKLINDDDNAEEIDDDVHKLTDKAELVVDGADNADDRTARLFNDTAQSVDVAAISVEDTLYSSEVEEISENIEDNSMNGAGQSAKKLLTGHIGEHKVTDQTDILNKNLPTDGATRTDSSFDSEIDDFDGGRKGSSDIDGESTTNKNQKPTYVHADITNSADNLIRKELDKGLVFMDNMKSQEAFQHFKYILDRYPQSPRAIVGLSQALCLQADEQHSNSLLEQCIEWCSKLLEIPDVPKALMIESGKTCANKQQFRGWGGKAAKLLRSIVDMYPEEHSLLNTLGVQYLMIGRSDEARDYFSKMLELNPDDAYALAHLGFIYKTKDNDLEKAIPLLSAALSSGDKSVIDGRFFFHLGDALQRTGNLQKAHSWYEKGANLGLFRSKWQRSLYNVDHLTGRAWWTPAQTGQEQLIKLLEENWEAIRDEGFANMDATGTFRPEDENLRETGDWKQFTLYQQGGKNEKNCKKAPKTCAIIDKFPNAAQCKRGQVKFSVMQPGVHVWPHCGPTNCRIRIHLGLSVPENCCRIRVQEDTRTWHEGKVIVFDDSFEHEVWHDGDAARLVLIVDIWHPELSMREKQSLTPI